MIQSAIPVFFLFFVSSLIYLRANKVNSLDAMYVVVHSLLFVIFSVTFFGFRDSGLGSDTEMYERYYNELSGLTFLDAIFYNRFEPGFSLYTYILSAFENVSVYFVGVALFQAVLFMWAAGKMFDRKLYVLFLLALLSLPFYINLSVNIIRQGLAMPLVLLATLCLINNERGKFVTYIIVASIFHYSALIFIMLLFLYRQRWPLKLYIFSWLCVVVFSALDLFKFMTFYVLDMAGFGEKFNAIFFQSKLDSYQTGFRVDFFLFSLLPFLMLFVVRRGMRWNLSSKVPELFKVYAVMNAVFIAVFFAPHSDRVGIYSWMMIPVFFVIFCSRDANVPWFSSSNDFFRRLFVSFFIFLIGLVGYLFLPLMNISSHLI